MSTSDGKNNMICRPIIIGLFYTNAKYYSPFIKEFPRKTSRESRKRF